MIRILYLYDGVEYANEANRIAHSAENLYKLGIRLELSDPRYLQYSLIGRAPISHTSQWTAVTLQNCHCDERRRRAVGGYECKSAE